MGLCISKDDKVPRLWTKFRTACAEWGNEEVSRAIHRVNDHYLATNSLLISRREYMEIFTDYDFGLIKDGTFLQVPLELFNIFEIEGRGIADAREILCLMVVLCRGKSLARKVELVFPMFGSTITQERCSQIISCFARGLYRLGILREKASNNSIVSLSNRMFGDSAWRKLKTISSQLFTDWLLNCEDIHPIIEFLTSESERNNAKQYNLFRDKEEMKQAGSLMRREVKKLLSLTMENKSAKPSKRSTKRGTMARQDLDKKRKDKGGKSNNNAPGKLQQSPLQSEQAQQLDAETFDAVSALDPNDLSILQKAWNGAKNPKKGLSEPEFGKIMQMHFPSLTNSQILSRMFSVFDTNKDGFLDYNEFVTGVCRFVAGGLEQKVRFLFAVANTKPTHSTNNKHSKDTIDEGDDNSDQQLDQSSGGGSAMYMSMKRKTRLGNNNNNNNETSSSSDDNGSADPLFGSSTNLSNKNPEERSMKLLDLVKLVQDTNNEMMECAAFTEVLISMMDANRDGFVDCSEFKDACESSPVLVGSLDECLAPSQKFKVSARRLFNAAPEFNPTNLLETYRALGSQKKNLKLINWETFINFLEPIWGNDCIEEEGDDEIARKAPSPKTTMLKRNHHSLRNFSPKAMSAQEVGECSSDSAIYTLLLNLFRSADDCEEPHHVDLRKMLVGIVISLEGTDFGGKSNAVKQSDKIALYFEVFDLDASGEVDFLEFYELLYSTQNSLMDESWKAVETLRDLDINGDGIITFSEFMEAAKKNKEILQSFGRILHVSMDEEDIDEEESFKKQAAIIEEEKSGETNNKNNNNNAEENEQEKKPLGESISEPALKSAEVSLLAGSSSTPALTPIGLPFGSVYRTTYQFKKKLQGGNHDDETGSISSDRGSKLKRQPSRSQLTGSPSNRTLTRQHTKSNLSRQATNASSLSNATMKRGPSARKLEPL